jgi:N-hydroxyarylamine O-acetyltransferase
LLSTPDELAGTLATVFGIENIDIAPIWPKILARHELLFGEAPIGEIEVRGM